MSTDTDSYSALHDRLRRTHGGFSTQPHVSPGGSQIDVICGPLLNYNRTSYAEGGGLWHGSVLIVTGPGHAHPLLELKPLGPVSGSSAQTDGANLSTTMDRHGVEGLKLYSDQDKVFWRFSIQVPLDAVESRWEYTIPGMHFLSEVSSDISRRFVVPSVNDSMRIMFHSCNGFSVGTDESFWSGPALWKDVLRTHSIRPFHVMIGGGDQIYNDGVRVDGPLSEWAHIANPKKRRDHPFDEALRLDCDKYYFENYVRWYSTEPFATANAAIPQINIWDDHDIIDGFGSYTDYFMECHVFRGIGGVSFKYYCLFQHHTAPPKSTYTTDAPTTMKAGADGSAGLDATQLKDTYVFAETADDPSWIVGTRPGPYVEERSRNISMRLGRRMAFCGIDARTERTRHQINYPETYDQIFARLKAEFDAGGGEIRHLILLLGVPIAYPRLAWLENVFTSPIIAPIRLLNKRFGIAGGFFNKFDGQVDLLDDLDDHYTSRHHKHERRKLILRLQDFAQKHCVRITILSGDVHLAALGRFYSNLKLNVPSEQDHRYIANIVSSAITNKPPPKAVANLLARRNRIHHLDHDTDETLLKMFDKQPGGRMKSADWNKCTMPSRNYACITEVPADAARTTNGDAASVDQDVHKHALFSKKSKKDGHLAIHPGEEHAGTAHPAADGVNTKAGIAGGLNVSIRVEIDNQSKGGETEGYGFSIPPLSIARGV